MPFFIAANKVCHNGFCSYVQPQVNPFTGGLNVLGAYWGIFAYTHFGVQATLWSAIAFAVVGAVFALWVNRSPSDNKFVSADAPQGGRIKARNGEGNLPGSLGADSETGPPPF